MGLWDAATGAYAGGMSPNDPAEVDRRFQELMRAEFSDAEAFSSDAAGLGEEASQPTTRPTGWVRPFRAGRVDDEDDDVLDLDFHDDQSYREVPEDAEPWSPMSMLGFVLLGAGLAGMFAMLFGVALGSPWAQLALAATIGGLVVLLVQALRAPGRDDDGDGARL